MASQGDGTRSLTIRVTDPELLPAVEQAHAWAWPQLFTIAAVKGACYDSDDWLEQVLDYIRGNQDAALDFIRTRMPKVKCACLSREASTSRMTLSALIIPVMTLPSFFLTSRGMRWPDLVEH